MATARETRLALLSVIGRWGTALSDRAGGAPSSPSEAPPYHVVASLWADVIVLVDQLTRLAEEGEQLQHQVRSHRPGDQKSM